MNELTIKTFEERFRRALLEKCDEEFGKIRTDLTAGTLKIEDLQDITLDDFIFKLLKKSNTDHDSQVVTSKKRGFEQEDGPSSSKRSRQLIDEGANGQLSLQNPIEEFSSSDFPHSKQLMSRLQQTFKLRQFKPYQEEVINAALMGNDCVVILGTGYGKSLCYQLPAIHSTGVAVVISPSKSLINDQQTQLKNLNISSVAITSDTLQQQRETIYTTLKAKTTSIKLLYITPEQLIQNKDLIQTLQFLYQRKRISMFAIDEAHCILDWGLDFRLEFGKLNHIRKEYPGVSIMALTATATPSERGKLVDILGLETPKIFVASVDRPNLRLLVRPKTAATKDKIEVEITRIILESYIGKCGIVYCNSRGTCESLSLLLNEAGVKTQSYHSGMTQDQRDMAQSDWINNRIQVLCATSAFGMGIDKPDVRFIIHHSPPFSINEYWQMCGRAGRDGGLSDCILMYSYDDMNVLRYRLSSTLVPEAVAKSKLQHIKEVVLFAENMTDCRRKLLLQYFGEDNDSSIKCQEDAKCSNCHSKDEYLLQPVRELTKKVVEFVQSSNGMEQEAPTFTIRQLAKILKGNASNNKTNRIDSVMYGALKEWDNNDVQRFIRKLINDEYLAEEIYCLPRGSPYSKLKLGLKALDFLEGEESDVIFYRTKDQCKPAGTTFSALSSNNYQMTKMQTTCLRELQNICLRYKKREKISSAKAFISMKALTIIAKSLPTNKYLLRTIVSKKQTDAIGDDLLKLTNRYANKLQTRQ